MAAVDYFLKIDGIDGESTDQQHKGEIQLESFSWGLSRTPGSASGRGGGGKAQVQDFHFVMKTNKSSPKLFLACATGEHFKKGVLALRKASQQQLEFLKIAFSDIIVSSFQLGATDEIPLEQVSLSFTRIEWEYTPQSASGQAGAKVKAGFDVKTNQAV